MTFQEFQALCDDAVANNQAVKSPCPIVIGDPAGPVFASYGDKDRQLVVFTEKPDNAALKPIVQSVHFNYDEATSETVISPVTTGA